jgi:hypothetical protein
VLNYFDPLFVLSPVWGPSGAHDLSEAGRRLAGSAVGWGLLGAGCIGLAVWRMRPVYIRELESIRPGKESWYSTERVGVEDEPIRWRERHVEGLAPNPTLRRIPQWLGILLVGGLSLISSLLILRLSIAPGKSVNDVLRAILHLDLNRVAALLPHASNGFLIQGVVAMLLASLVVGIRCSGSITGEREKQTWEALLLTPISAKQMIRGKLWGVMWASYWYLLAYAAPAVTLSVFAGPLALCWTVLWLAVTVLAMYFIGATGLWCSVRSRNSWRSLLFTLGMGYVGGALMYVVTSPVIALFALLLVLLLYFIDVMIGTQMAALCLRNFPAYLQVFFVSSCVGLAVLFLLLARLFLSRAQRWVADRERTRHWYEEPIYRRSRRSRGRPRLTRSSVDDAGD